MSSFQPEPQLFVDLDGTLIKTDLLLESLLLLLKKNPLLVLLVPLWLLRGRAYLKHQLSLRIQVPLDHLPYNKEFLGFLENEKARGRRMTLISASNQSTVNRVQEQSSLFDDAIGSDEASNLKATKKLERILELSGEQGFAYAGNESADIPIWNEASEIILVNCDDSLAQKADSVGKKVMRFDSKREEPQKFLQAMRPHQWLKNGLIFLPLILSHQLDQPTLILSAFFGFVSFCLCASSVYLLNDMLDLNADRRHRSKHRRPFASGELSLAWGFIGAPLLLLAAILVALSLPPQFLNVMLVYWLLTCIYSLLLKRLFFVDMATLALLYTIRIVAGSAAIEVLTTVWLLGFSLALFLGLAAVKRVTELSKLDDESAEKIDGRAYSIRHIKSLSAVGGLASLAAVAVFAFYINVPETTRLYSSPSTLWLICPLLLYLLARIWRFALQGKLEDDPVLFALSDHQSQLITVMCGLLIWLAI